MPVAEASYVVAATPERASRVILAPEALPKWFRNARNVRAEPGYPAPGTTIAWEVGRGGRWRFAAKVVENALPARLRMEVRTPSGPSLVSHAFEALPGGTTRYTKRVEFPRPPGLQGLLVPRMLRGLVRREVFRAAALVEGRLR